MGLVLVSMAFRVEYSQKENPAFRRAMWSAIQMLYVMGETYYASQQEMLTEARTDVYGIGFRLYRRSYDLERNGEIPTVTPFQSFPPLEPEEIRELFQGME